MGTGGSGKATKGKFCMKQRKVSRYKEPPRHRSRNPKLNKSNRLLSKSQEVSRPHNRPLPTKTFTQLKQLAP